jgi:hypothetical protein
LSGAGVAMRSDGGAGQVMSGAGVVRSDAGAGASAGWGTYYVVLGWKRGVILVLGGSCLVLGWR